MNANLSAGVNAVVWTLGDVTGTYSAGQDAAVFTYGNFHAGLFAGRDVGDGHGAGVWAVGNIEGAVSAGRHIRRVQSYGSINAALYAGTDSAYEGEGWLQEVIAWGPIAGDFASVHSIGTVRSGGAVTASLTAPYVYQVIDYDPDIETAYPFPDIPDSVLDEVLLAGAEAYAKVLDQAADRRARGAAYLAEMAEHELADRTALAEARAELEQALADDRAAAMPAMPAPTIATSCIFSFQNTRIGAQRFLSGKPPQRLNRNRRRSVTGIFVKDTSIAQNESPGRLHHPYELVEYVIVPAKA